MATNTLKPVNQPRVNAPRQVAAIAPEPVQASQPEPALEPRAPKAPREPRPAPSKRNTWSVFSLLERVTRVDGLFREGLPVRYLPKLLFIMFLTLVYIGNTHYATRMNRSIQKLKVESEDLRADYTTLKSDYMEASKQSEVARKVAAYGLIESSSPPFRISVPAGHLDEAELDRLPVLTADSVAAMLARAKADSLRRVAGPAVGDTVEVGAPPVPIGSDLNGEPASTTESASSNRSATPRRNERKR